MGNHVHLIIQVGYESLSSIMQNVSFRFTRYFNTRQERIGHLFQGRYRAILIDSNSYLLPLRRYIHCNPVRAGIVKNPDEFQWSSHMAYLGTIPISWLTRALVLSQFSRSQEKATELYADFVQQGIAVSHRHEFHKGTHDGRILGNDSFSEKVITLANQKDTVKITLFHIIDAVCAEYRIEGGDLFAPGKKRPFAEARAIVAVLVQEEEQLSLTELGKRCNRDLAALSRAAGRIRERLQADFILQDRISLLKKQLT